MTHPGLYVLIMGKKFQDIFSNIKEYVVEKFPLVKVHKHNTLKFSQGRSTSKVAKLLKHVDLVKVEKKAKKMVESQLS